jgi:hypothetical protein
VFYWIIKIHQHAVLSEGDTLTVRLAFVVSLKSLRGATREFKRAKHLQLVASTYIARQTNIWSTQHNTAADVLQGSEFRQVHFQNEALKPTANTNVMTLKKNTHKYVISNSPNALSNASQSHAPSRQ